MKYIKLFDSVADMTVALVNSPISVLGMAMDGNTPVVKVKVVNPPTNLVISCSNNTVTISATNAATLEYNTDGSSTYTAYTEAFEISQTVTVYAKATNGGGSITASQECEYVPVIDYTIPFYIEDISGSANTIQIKKSKSSAPTLTIEKSTDGKTWETMGTTSTNAISATVPANGKLYLRCSATTWSNSNYNYFNSATGNFNVGGNINSLLYGSSFNRQTKFPSGVGTYAFGKLFYNNTRIRSAEHLLLPATTLAGGCYYSMFQGCTLTTAPTLPATTLASSCYEYMFYGCFNLNYIKCLATNISANYCTHDWVQNVASTGTFVKAASMSNWKTGTSGIPTNWTVQDATE